MDRSLDEIINGRPAKADCGRPARNRDNDDQRPRPARSDRDYDRAPRDLPPRSDRRDGPANTDRDWVHDRYDDDKAPPRNGARDDDRRRRYSRSPSPPPRIDARLRVDNLHYEVDARKLEDLFSRIGDIKDVKMLYDRNDRSQGTAFVTFYSESDARRAIDDFDGANAYGKPIQVRFAPRADRQRSPPRAARNPFDYVENPSRSLFDRISGDGREPERTTNGRGRRERSRSPDRRGGRENGGYGGKRERSRSPARGGRDRGRDGNRRGGERRDNAARGRGRGRDGGRGGEGRRETAPRGKKTAEELDAEMNDYWGSKPAVDAGAADGQAADNHTTAAQGLAVGGAPPAVNADDDLDLMVE